MPRDTVARRCRSMRRRSPEGRRTAVLQSASEAPGLASTRSVAASAQPTFLRMGDCTAFRLGLGPQRLVIKLKQSGFHIETG